VDCFNLGFGCGAEGEPDCGRMGGSTCGADVGSGCDVGSRCDLGANRRWYDLAVKLAPRLLAPQHAEGRETRAYQADPLR
jgi:hypothetical protein